MAIFKLSELGGRPTLAIGRPGLLEYSKEFVRSRESRNGFSGEALVAMLGLSLFIAIYVALEVEDTFMSSPERASDAAFFAASLRLFLQAIVVKLMMKVPMNAQKHIVTMSPEVVKSFSAVMHTSLPELSVEQSLPGAQAEESAVVCVQDVTPVTVEHADVVLVLVERQVLEEDEEEELEEVIVEVVIEDVPVEVEDVVEEVVEEAVVEVSDVVVASVVVASDVAVVDLFSFVVVASVEADVSDVAVVEAVSDAAVVEALFLSSPASSSAHPEADPHALAIHTASSEASEFEHPPEVKQYLMLAKSTRSNPSSKHSEIVFLSPQDT